MADFIKLNGYTVKDPKALHTFNTVADMQNDSELIKGMFVRTLGYNTVGDKMGGIYQIVSESSGNIQLKNNLYAKYIKQYAIVSIDDYDGKTAEDRLFKALDDLDAGVIIGGDITITKQYNTLNKDYRKITITNCNIDIQCDHWFNQNGSVYNSVPAFSNCTIKGNGNKFYSGGDNCIGSHFDNCIFNGNICIFNSSDKYIQSPYFVNCQMYEVENLFTAFDAYDFKMIGCRVESSAGKLVVITGTYGLRQGSVDSTLIEGRPDVVFELSSMFSFSITNCYFEACQSGIVSQLGSSGSCYLIFENNLIIESLATTDYVISLESVAYGRACIKNNTTNIANGKYMCNKPILNRTLLDMQNYNYSDSNTNFDNNGFKGDGPNNAYDKLTCIANNAVWDSSDSTWKCEFYLPYGEAFSVVSPYLLCFVGSFEGSPQYRGYANILVTPRVGYSNAVKLMVDAQILHSCNTNGITPSSSVTVSATIDPDTVNATKVKVTVKIGGFSSASGRFRATDLLSIVSSEHKFLS